MQKPFNVNPITKNLKTFTFFNYENKIPKYIKLAELVVVQVIGYVENECFFSTLTFIKTKLWNWLTMHLELVIYMFN